MRNVEDITGITTAQNPPNVFPTFHVVGLDPPNRGPESFTVAEHPFHRDLTWGVTLSRTLWRDPAFRQHVDFVRSSQDPRKTAYDLAVKYGRGERRRSLVANLLLTAAMVPSAYSARMLDLIWLRPISGRHESPLREFRRVNAKAVANATRGSKLIARRGAGLCIVPDCDEPRLKVSVNNRVVIRQGIPDSQSYEMLGDAYCAAHHGDDARYGDEKAIERTFAAAIEAWPSSKERDVLHWWSGQREANAIAESESARKSATS